MKPESKNGVGDSDAVDGYPSHSIPIEGDGVKIETGAECDEPVDDNTGTCATANVVDFLSFLAKKFKNGNTNKLLDRFDCTLMLFVFNLFVATAVAPCV